MKDNTTTPKVLAYLQRHPGVIMYYKDIAADLSIANAANANSALVRMAKVHPEYGVRRKGSGMYVFLTADAKAPVVLQKQAGPMMYEEVGTTRAGDVIVRDEKGMLWKLSEQL